MKIKILFVLSVVLWFSSPTVFAVPTSQLELRSAIETSLQSKDRAGFSALYNWEGVSDKMKSQQDQMIDMIFSAGHNSVEIAPLPSDFKDEYVLNGVRLSPNVKIIGFMALTGGGKTGALTLGPVQVPFGTKGGNFYLSNTIEETASSQPEKDVSLNISVGGTISPNPVRFSGFFIYRQNGKDVREEIKGKGNKSVAILGEQVKYCEIRKTSKSGVLWLKVLEGGQTVFSSKKVSSHKPIIYRLKNK